MRSPPVLGHGQRNWTHWKARDHVVTIKRSVHATVRMLYLDTPQNYIYP